MKTSTTYRGSPFTIDMARFMTQSLRTELCNVPSYQYDRALNRSVIPMGATE